MIRAVRVAVTYGGEPHVSDDVLPAAHLSNPTNKDSRLNPNVAKNDGRDIVRRMVWRQKLCTILVLVPLAAGACSTSSSSRFSESERASGGQSASGGVSSAGRSSSGGGMAADGGGGGSGGTIGLAGAGAAPTNEAGAGTSGGAGATGGAAGAGGNVNASGSAGDVANGGRATSSEGTCTVDSDCTLHNDCCSCIALAPGEKPPICEMVECLLPHCAPAMITQAEVRCVAGRCVIDRSCAPPKTSELPPQCDTGELPTRADSTHWRGSCLKLSECQEVADCTVCKQYGLACATEETILGPVAHCVSTPEKCEKDPSCECLGVCIRNYECADPKSQDLSCQCPTC